MDIRKRIENSVLFADSFVESRLCLMAFGFVLQERTNLVLGAWAFSTSGATNLAVVPASGNQKFYRLYKPTGSSELPQAALVVSVPVGSYRLTTHIQRTRQP